MFVFPENLSRIQLAKEVAQLLEHQTIRSDPSRVESIHQVSLELGESILSTKDSMSWPPKPADLTEDAIEIPDNIRTFLSTLLTGNMEPPKLYSERVQRLVNLFWTRPDFRSDLWTSQDPQAHTSATCRQVIDQ